MLLSWCAHVGLAAILRDARLLDAHRRPVALFVSQTHRAPTPAMYGEEKLEDDGKAQDATRAYLESTMEGSFSRYTDEGSRILNAPQRYSSKDWLTTLLSLKSDRGLHAVRFQFVSTVLFSLLVALFYIRFPRMPTLPALPHSLLGGVLSVLLGFRTNQSYQRFWEGRILWGKVFDRCRTILRTALAYMDGSVETYEAILRHLKAFPTALKQHLRGGQLDPLLHGYHTPWPYLHRNRPALQACFGPAFPC